MVSAISESMVAPGRYHSSMVNSGACRSLPSPFRQTRGKLEDRSRTADQQLLHGEFRTGVQPERLARAVGIFAFGGEGAQVDLLAGGRDGVGRFHLGVAARGEEGAGGRGQQGAAAQEGKTRGKAFGVPGGMRHVVKLTSERPMPLHRHDCDTA